MSAPFHQEFYESLHSLASGLQPIVIGGTSQMLASILSMALLVVPQHDGKSEDVRCGAYCLFVGLKSLGLEKGDFASFDVKNPLPSDQGYSIATLAQIAASRGASVLSVKTTLEQLTRRNRPFVCIAFLEKRRHFVIVKDVRDGMVAIVDPPGEYEMVASAFSSVWRGEALLLSTTPLAPMDVDGHARIWVWSLLLVVAVCGLWAVIRISRYVKAKGSG